MIGWIVTEVAYVHLVGDGDDITLSTNITDTGSNKVHRCYSDVSAGIWEIYVCCHGNKSICMDNPAAIGRATIDDIILYYTTTSSGNMYSHTHYIQCYSHTAHNTMLYSTTIYGTSTSTVYTITEYTTPSSTITSTTTTTTVLGNIIVYFDEFIPCTSYSLT